MYYALYDKDFNAIGKRKTYPCSSWSLKRRAYGFDELMIEGVAIESIDGATYVGLHENYGRLTAFAFSGIPKTEDGITRINAIDIRQILNNEAIIDLTLTTINSVQSLYVYLLSCLFEQYDELGIEAIIDTTELVDNPLTFKEETLDRSKAIGNIWNTVQAVNAVYDCYVEGSVDFIGKYILLKVRRINQQIDIKLSDFKAPKIKNDQTGINRALCADTAYLDGVGTQVSTYYLMADNRVLTRLEAMQTVNRPFIIYPPVIKGFVDEDFASAKAKGIEELYKNRFQSTVEIDLSNQMGYMLKDVGLNAMGKIYGYNSDDSSSYKELPVMEISDDHMGKKKIRFGRLEEYWWP